jgi:hypothetical protein
MIITTFRGPGRTIELSGAIALSWKTSARSDLAISSTIFSVEATPETSGIRNLRDCLEASRAVF